MFSKMLYENSSSWKVATPNIDFKPIHCILLIDKKEMISREEQHLHVG